MLNQFSLSSGLCHLVCVPRREGMVVSESIGVCNGLNLHLTFRFIFFQIRGNVSIPVACVKHMKTEGVFRLVLVQELYQSMVQHLWWAWISLQVLSGCGFHGDLQGTAAPFRVAVLARKEKWYLSIKQNNNRGSLEAIEEAVFL